MTIEAGKLLRPQPGAVVHPGPADARRSSGPRGGSRSITATRCAPIAAHAVGAHHLLAACTGSVMIGVRFLLWTNGGKPAAGVAWSDLHAAPPASRISTASLMVYAAIVGVSHAIAYYHESQERKLKSAQLETRLIEARLKTLEAELHPHFLFNTLHAISTLVHRDPESADRMISRLSDLLRITFDRTGEPKVSLKDEIDFLQKYLDIEQTRFQDRLTVQREHRSGGARRRGPAHDPAAAGRKRDQARHRRPHWRRYACRSPPRRATKAERGSGCRSATTARGCRCAR